VPDTLTVRRFTVDEYYRMAEAGILGPGERVELIEGEIIQVAAIGSRHAGCVKRLIRLLVRGVGDRGLVQAQDPVRLDDVSEPEPDIALLRPRADDYTSAHPGPEDVLLIIEVADTTTAFDREVKGPLYAAAGIREYWLVDLDADRVEVFRDPRGRTYRHVTSHGRGDVLRPAELPELEVPLQRILP
jgi:Uma2 family endonuclease